MRFFPRSHFILLSTLGTLNLLSTSGLSKAESSYWGKGIYLGHEPFQTNPASGISFKSYYPIGCALDGPNGSVKSRRFTDFIRRNEGDDIEALQFRNIRASIYAKHHLRLEVSTLLLRCDRGGMQPGAAYHWEAFRPRDDEALLVKSEFKTQLSPYTPQNDPLKGSQAIVDIDLMEKLNGTALLAGKVLEMRFSIYHAFPESSQSRYSEYLVSRAPLKDYRIFKAHNEISLRIKMSKGSLSIVRALSIK